MQEIDVSAKELAHVFGVSDRLVRELVGRDLAVKTARGRYRLIESTQRYTEHLRIVAAGRGGEEAQLDLTAERARLAKESADEKAMRNARERRETLLAEDVAREWSDIVRRVRAGMLAVTSRIRQRLPEIDAAQAEIIDREIRDALMVMADDDVDGNEAAGAGGASAAAKA